MKVQKFFLNILCIFLITSCSAQISEPWGIWNKQEPSKQDNIRNADNVKYFEVGDDGLWIIKDISRIFPGSYKEPGFAVTGAYNKVTKYQELKDGFVFTLQGEGFRNNPIDSSPEWNDETLLTLKMTILDDETCIFEYLTQYTPESYKLSYIPLENVKYYRKRIK